MSKAVEKRRDIAPVPQGQLVATAIPESSPLQQTENVGYFWPQAVAAGHAGPGATRAGPPREKSTMRTTLLAPFALSLSLLGCVVQGADDEVSAIDPVELSEQETTTPEAPAKTCTVKCGSNNETCQPLGSVVLTGTMVGTSCCSATRCSVCDSPDYFSCTSSVVVKPVSTSPPLLSK